ncbi:MAG: YHYH protein [Pirellulaceae bacterium]
MTELLVGSMNHYLAQSIDLGIDVSHAHVQPTGKYHYHGLPTGLLDSVKLDPSKHSPLIGWAAMASPCMQSMATAILMTQLQKFKN